MSRMTGVEVLTEAEYLLTFGEHPARISQVLGRTPEGIYRMAYRAGNNTVQSAFSVEVAYCRRLKEGVHA